MRNDIKPVRHDPNRPPPTGGGLRGSVSHDADTPGPRGEADFDRQGGSGIRRERGDTVDPAGPKRSQVYGALGSGGAVTDPSGTTGPVSRSNDRTSTTTGKLRDRDLERSARQGEAPDVNVLPISTGDSSFSVPLAMGIAALVVALLALILFLAWPTGNSATGANTSDPAVPRAGDVQQVEQQLEAEAQSSAAAEWADPIEGVPPELQMAAEQTPGGAVQQAGVLKE